jgi:hypothetical protein
MTASVETKNVGHITQIIGPVIDAVFSPGMPTFIMRLLFKVQMKLVNSCCYMKFNNY